MDALLRAVVSEPDRGRRRPAAVLSRFDADDPALRLGAAAAVGAVVEAHPGTAEYFASRLADRHDGESPAVAAALQYLLSAYPEQTRAALDAEAGDGDEAVRPVGNVSLELHQTRTDRDSDLRVLTDESEATEGEEDDGEEEEETDTETDGEADDVDDGPSGLVVAREVAERSAVADVDQIAPASGIRHADAYDAIGRLDGGTENVLIKRFEAAAREPFERGVARWERVADHDNVVAVHDWGRQPDPWTVVAYSTDTLAGRAPLAPEAAVDATVRLARAVAYAHQRDVLHGGIEPRNVVLAPRDGGAVPMLTNVGLVPELGGAVPFDPRYAAPEFFDDSLGGVDAQSDAYQLGALAYSLLTGRPPVAEDADSIRAGVLKGPPGPPSDVVDGVPAALDDVIATATATEKLQRYRSVERFATQLSAVER